MDTSDLRCLHGSRHGHSWRGHGPSGSGHRADGFSRAELPPSPAPIAPLPSGMTRVFDGKTLAGWKQIPADQWIVKDGALVSLGKGRGVIATEAKYSKYRIIFDIRHVSAEPKKDHPACVLFFLHKSGGEREAAGHAGSGAIHGAAGVPLGLPSREEQFGKCILHNPYQIESRSVAVEPVELARACRVGHDPPGVAQPPGGPRSNSADSRIEQPGKKGHSPFRCTTPA